MFKDYYAILEIEQFVSIQEIKSAYRKQCLKWHPDKNPNKNTMEIMQDIIEAYLVIKDEESKKRYDQIYNKFRQEKKSSNQQEKKTHQKQYEYEFSDDILKKWMENAKKQAIKMRDEVIDEFKGAIKESGKSIRFILNYMLPFILGYLLIKGCTFFMD